MEFKTLLDWAKAQAILNTLEGTEYSVWRSVCRSYSKTYSTPLHLCLNGDIPPEDILLAEFESQLEDIDLEKDIEHILDQIYRLEDPEYERNRANELDDFIVQAELEEKERIKKKKPIHSSLRSETSKKTLPKSVDELTKNLPKGGHLNLSHLDSNDGEYGNFED